MATYLILWGKSIGMLPQKSAALGLVWSTSASSLLWIMKCHPVRFEASGWKCRQKPPARFCIQSVTSFSSEIINNCHCHQEPLWQMRSWAAPFFLCPFLFPAFDWGWLLFHRFIQFWFRTLLVSSFNFLLTLHSYFFVRHKRLHLVRSYLSSLKY